MSEIVIRPASFRDLELLPVAADEKRRTIELLQYAPDVNRILHSLSRAMVKDGLPIAVYGVWPMWEGVAQAWSSLSQEALCWHKKSLHRGVSEALGAFQDIGRMRRIEAIVRDKHEAGRRWVERLGFEHEGVLRKYGRDGSDCHMYARLRTWT